MVKNQRFFPAFVLISFLFISGCGQTLPAESPEDPISTDQLDQMPTPDILVRELDGMVQVLIPGGSFLMGSTAEEVDAGIAFCREHYQYCNRWFFEEEYPQHAVRIGPYLIDQFEVSNQQYQLCVEAGVCQVPLSCEKGEPTYQDGDKKDHPVVCVSWQDAWDYCHWAGARLPTEAEWEFASRGPENNSFPWGDEFDGTLLNYCDQRCDQPHQDPSYDDGYQKTSPVEAYPAGRSWTHVAGLGGNVAEWVGDWDGDYGPETLQDPTGPDAGTEKMIKGTSWYFPAVYSRGANRGSTDPAWWTDYIGFRCAGDLDPLIDGSIQPGEWDGSRRMFSENGSELFLAKRSDLLFLALRSAPLELVSGNVFISTGDEIRIMHTSAALGTAIYHLEGDNWVKTRDFEWCCRSRTDNAAARSMREAFYDTDGWLGINSFNGVEGELEHIIKLDGSEEYLAVNITSSGDPEKKQVWPVGIVDGPALVLRGEFPETMEFQPEYWISLEEVP